jgi:hypothetical protein
VIAQLRNVLAAEDSTVVPKEDYDGGGIGPEIAEADRAFLAIGEGDSGEPRAERGIHGWAFWTDRENGSSRLLFIDNRR